MKFNENQVAFMRKIGVQIDDYMNITDDDYVVIERKVSSYLMERGFDQDYMPTREGTICESILDMIAEENEAMNDMQMELNRLIQRVERKKVRAIEEQYGLELNDEAKRVFSMASDDPIFLGEDGSVRILSMDEILEASEDMEVDFASYQIIPIADVYDNDYIVYDAKNECWCMFNIVDEVKFGKEKNFIDCFDEDADDDDEDFDDEDFE